MWADYFDLPIPPFDFSKLKPLYNANDLVYSMTFIAYSLYAFHHGCLPDMADEYHDHFCFTKCKKERCINFEDYCRFLLSRYGNTSEDHTVISRKTGEIYPLVLILLGPIANLVDFETVIVGVGSFAEGCFKALPASYALTQRVMDNKIEGTTKEVPFSKTVSDLKMFFFKLTGMTSIRQNDLIAQAKEKNRRKRDLVIPSGSLGQKRTRQ